MALIKTTAVVDAISGKLNGTVFAHNKGGQYMRSRSLVANQRSDEQIAQRARMTGFSQMWRSLTQEQRNAWEQATDSWPYQNRLGDTKTLSGFGLYIKLNTNLALVEESPLTEPLPKGQIRSFNGSASLPKFEVDEDVDNITFSLGLNVEGVSESNRFLIRATPGISPGISNATNFFRLFMSTHTSFNSASTHITAGDFSNIEADYQERFGVPEIGSVVHFELTPIGKSGVRGPRMSFSVPVTESEGS